MSGIMRLNTVTKETREWKCVGKGDIRIPSLYMIEFIKKIPIFTREHSFVFDKENMITAADDFQWLLITWRIFNGEKGMKLTIFMPFSLHCSWSKNELLSKTVNTTVNATAW